MAQPYFPPGPYGFPVPPNNNSLAPDYPFNRKEELPHATPCVSTATKKKSIQPRGTSRATGSRHTKDEKEALVALIKEARKRAQQEKSLDKSIETATSLLDTLAARGGGKGINERVTELTQDMSELKKGMVEMHSMLCKLSKWCRIIMEDSSSSDED